MLNKQSAMTGAFSKVPEVTIFFWIIKVLCTTVGETAADFLNVNLSIGLTGTSVVTGILLAIALVAQFRSKRYIPTIYWTVVVLVSIFGTLITDNLTDNLKVPLVMSTVIFFVALMGTFSIWFASERTLSIHSIFTSKREVFYWLAILFTFALGTAFGDLLAEQLSLGYLVTGISILTVVALVAVGWRLKLDAILAFWIVYILTRPLGASLGDLLSQSVNHGGVGLGTTVTSAIFLLAIGVTIVYLSLTKRDLTASAAVKEDSTRPRVVILQLVGVLVLVLGGAVVGYSWRQQTLDQEVRAAAETEAPTQTIATSSQRPAPSNPLGDLSEIRTIVNDTLGFVTAGNLTAAVSRVDDLEYQWDKSQSTLKPKNPATWTVVDTAIDKVLRQLRAVHPDPTGCMEVTYTGTRGQSCLFRGGSKDEGTKTVQ